MMARSISNCIYFKRKYEKLKKKQAQGELVSAEALKECKKQYRLNFLASTIGLASIIAIGIAIAESSQFLFYLIPGFSIIASIMTAMYTLLPRNEEGKLSNFSKAVLISSATLLTAGLIALLILAPYIVPVLTTIATVTAITSAILQLGMKIYTLYKKWNSTKQAHANNESNENSYNPSENSENDISSIESIHKSEKSCESNPIQPIASAVKNNPISNDNVIEPLSSMNNPEIIDKNIQKNDITILSSTKINTKKENIYGNSSNLLMFDKSDHSSSQNRIEQNHSTDNNNSKVLNMVDNLIDYIDQQSSIKPAA